MERLFTIEEANRLLPILRPILRDLAREWKFMQLINPEIRKAHEAADRSGGSPAGRAYVDAAEEVVHCIHRVQELGVLLKDPAAGLCDFPYQHKDRVVYLCWRLGEERILWWHDIEAGFAGREPLDDLDES